MATQDLAVRNHEKNERPNAQPHIRCRLTKRILMSLPTGVILSSNVGYEPFKPIFEGVLGPIAERENTWATMRKLNVTGRTFSVFATKESYDHEMRQRLIAITRLH